MEAAALKRRDHVEARPTTLTEVERVLLRALAITDPEFEESRRVAVDAVTRQSQWFEGLATFEAMQQLAGRGARDPMEVVTDEAQRALLAETLLAETDPPADTTVIGAVVSQEKRQIENELRDLRTRIGEAERRGDHAEVVILTQRKLELDRALRQVKGPGPAGKA